jgi:hypothetical protein
MSNGNTSGDSKRRKELGFQNEDVMWLEQRARGKEVKDKIREVTGFISQRVTAYKE